MEMVLIESLRERLKHEESTFNGYELLVPALRKYRARLSHLFNVKNNPF